MMGYKAQVEPCDFRWTNLCVCVSVCVCSDPGRLCVHGDGLWSEGLCGQTSAQPARANQCVEAQLGYRVAMTMMFLMFKVCVK